jgi:maltose O-acetyltransferase
MTEKDKMLEGMLYNAFDPPLVFEREWAKSIMQRYNTQVDPEKKKMLLSRLLCFLGDKVWVESPFYVDYGYNISIGDNTFINVNCVLLDANRIAIGKNVLLAPNVQLYTSTHSLDPEERAKGLETAAPITIEDNVWLCGGVIIGPGVTVGKNTTVGAGSVVMRDVPPNVVAFGNPCRVVRSIG